MDSTAPPPQVVIREVTTNGIAMEVTGYDDDTVKLLDVILPRGTEFGK